MPNQEDQHKHDPGFLFSLNLMVLGGALLMFVIISLNKLLNHYLQGFLDQNKGILYSVNEMENDAFQINSVSELYLNWFAFLLSLAGLIVIIAKLVKTWKD